MKQSTPASRRSSVRLGAFLERNSGKVILATLALTILLVTPLLTMGSEEQASSDPAGEVFDLRDDINDRFASSVHGVGYIAESRTGDILTQAALWELYQNSQRLREDDQKGALAPEGLSAQSYLYQAFDTDANRSFLGIYSLADAVQEVLVSDQRFGATLETATDRQVKLALYRLFSNPQTSGMKDFLSIKAQSEKLNVAGLEVDYWTSPALLTYVLADNEKLGGGTLEITVGGGETTLDKEEFNRNVQRVLRGNQETFRLWGIAIDVNLEASSEGQTAGYFIMVTVIAVVLIAGVSLRSYWVVVLTSAGLASLMIWLKGISNLVGLKGGLVVDLIVPIAMVSLGVDFALHALQRYREEKRYGYAPGMALRAAFAGVLGALTLAVTSDSIAFIANTSSGIEAVIHFGLAAGIAVVSSFIVLGVVLPLVMLRIDRLQPTKTTSPSRRARLKTLLNSVGAASLAGAGVILLVAVSEAIGVAILFALVIGYLVIPVLIMQRRQARRTQEHASAPPAISPPARGVPDGWFVNLVAGMARYRLVVLLVMAGITAAATVFATRLEATFDAKDFFDSQSDFVVSLDKLDEHVGETGGEPGIIYISGDLTDPRAVAAIDRFIESLADNSHVARTTDGEVQLWSRTAVSLLRRIMGSEYALGRVAAVTGIQPADSDGDQLPDSPAQIKAVYRYMLTEGVPRDGDTLVYTPGQVREVLFHDPDGSEDDVTILTVEIPGTRQQQKVIVARDSFADSLKALNDSPGIVHAGLTGSPFTRLAQLEATAKTLQTSLPIAAAAVLVLLLVVMRSLRYAVVTIVPIGLVVAWLYGLMYLSGFALNYVTATVGAVSLGVGIDYSIHMTERFREEMGRAPDKMQALRRAANGTGVALLASAATSIVGFGIMGFAPMPMFSSYGILTVLMIFLALLASLVVLPSLLLLVTPEKATEVTTDGSKS